jgi:hypothetical protein
MGCLDGSSVPVLYIGRTVPKGYNSMRYNLKILHLCATGTYKLEHINWHI